jgi:glycosyltransferase involved in cell wall biosynthesis
MTKIVHMTSVHVWHDTRILYKECQTLAKEGFKVILVASRGEKAVNEAGGVSVRLVPRSRRRLARMLETGFRIFRAARGERADLYHIHDPELLPWAHLLRLLGKPVIYDMHENLPGALLTKEWISPPLRRPASVLFGWLERVLLFKLPVIFAESSYSRHYPAARQTTIVLNLPDTSPLQFIREDKFGRFTAGYMGGISEVRGSRAMVEAVRMLYDRGLRAGLQCVGPISEVHKSVLCSEVYKEQSADIVFHGRLPPQDGWRIMARCHAGLAVLQAVPNYVESYPTKMFEYMALGLPVVVSDFPLYRDIVERHACGICVDPSTPGQIADALLFLSEHPQEALTMGARGREAVLNEFNWPGEADKLIGFYRSILAR